MSYKTIFVHVDESRHVERRIEAAARIALAENAHLVGVAMSGVPAFMLYDPTALNPADPAKAPYLHYLRQRAAQALGRFEQIAARMGLPSIETRIVENVDERDISQLARCADLVVVGQHDPHDSDAPIPPDFPEYVIMNSGIAGLVIPNMSRVRSLGDRVLIAWNGSIEATRAVHYALPMLERATHVDLAIFNPEDEPEIHEEAPAEDITLFLNRHRIQSNVIVRRTDGSVGDALLALADSMVSDLLVMGCYGHSRLREIVLGGASTSVLRSTHLPVLMAH
jgi:nucleotide-binding universal stress UspA family protein